MSVRDERVNARDLSNIYPVEKRLTVLQTFTATGTNTLTFIGLLLMHHREHHNYYHHV